LGATLFFLTSPGLGGNGGDGGSGGSTVGSAGAVYVTNIANGVPRVSVIDSNAASPQVEFSLRVGNSPRGVAVSPDGSRVYVANYDDDTLSVIDTSAVAALPGAAGGVGDKTGARALGGSGGAGAYTNKLVTSTITVGNGPSGVAVNSQNTVYVTNNLADNMTVIAANGTINTIAVGDGPNGVATIYPLVFVANRNSDNVTFIGNPGPIAVGNSPFSVAYPAGSLVYVTNYLSDSLSVINTATSTATSILVGDVSGPVGIAANQAGTRLYVTNANNGTVSVINAFTRTVIATIAVQPNPRGVAINPAGTRLFITDASDNRVAVINIADNSVAYTPTVGSSSSYLGIASNPF
jgi:YVTN family beta-propeller protein